MKLNTLCAQLVPVLGREMSDFTELLRALKEGSGLFDPATELDKTTREGAEHGFDPDILKARPGPQGGLDATPFRAAFMLLAIMTGATRREATQATWRAWHLSREGSILFGWGEDWQPTLKTCRLTGKHLFGDAFKVIIEQPRLAARVSSIRLGADETAEIIYDEDKASRFDNTNPRKRQTAAFNRVAVLDGAVVKKVAELLAQ